MYLLIFLSYQDFFIFCAKFDFAVLLWEQGAAREVIQEAESKLSGGWKFSKLVSYLL